MIERLWTLVSLSVLAPFFLLIPGVVGAEEKTVIGGVEDVILLPWRVRLPARIDTGAAKSSLDARELKIQDDIVEFRLPQKHGGLHMRLPVVEWRHIRTQEGLERRPVVEVDICLGTKRIRTLVNLNDRSMVKYPLILGRNFLKENFLVDVQRRRMTRPICPETP